MKFSSSTLVAFIVSLAASAPLQIIITEETDLPSISAHPCNDAFTAATPQVKIRLTNDNTGRGELTPSFPADGTKLSLSKAFKNTSIQDPDGKIRATSALMNVSPSGVVCVFKDGSGSPRGQIGERNSFIAFGGVVVVDGWIVSCVV